MARPIAVVVAALIVSAGAFGATRLFAGAPGVDHPTSTSPSTSAGRTPFAGPFGIGTAVLTFSESGSGGGPERVVTTYLRYPTLGVPAGTESTSALPDRRDGPYPLVVFSQGFDIAASSYSAMLDAWSEAGFVVAEPVYPFTDPSLSAGVDRADLVHHPADLSYVITGLIGKDSQSSSPLYEMIDTSEIVVAGQSDGGDVSLAASVGSCCRDSRVTAAIILSGAEYAPFGGSYFGGRQVPMLLTQGTADTINPESCSNQIFDASGESAYYVKLIGADHLEAYTTESIYARIVDSVTVDFLEGVTRRSPRAFAKLAQDASVAGVSSFTHGGPALAPTGPCPDAPPG